MSGAVITTRVSSGSSFSGGGTGMAPLALKVAAVIMARKATRVLTRFERIRLLGFTSPRAVFMSLHNLGVTRAAGGFKVTIGVAGVVSRISVSIPMIEEEFDGFDGNGEAQAFAESDLHVSDADDFT